MAFDLLLLSLYGTIKIEATWSENLILLYANNKNADQFMHPDSLICTSVIRFLDPMIN